jgi:diguanylate cyclase (GGDEF)-like protein/PAS domain S-box-containing protein
MEDAGAIRRLRVTGAIAVLTIALLTISSAAFTTWRYSTAQGRSDLVNLSGLRRGQSVAVIYRAERLTRFPNEVPALDAAIDRLEASEAALADLSPEDQAFYRHFVDAARAVAAHPDDASLRDRLESMGDRMYRIFYDTTIGYTRRLAAQRDRSFHTTIGGDALMLLVLGLLYAFVIRPGEAHVGRNVSKLEERRQRLSAMFDNSSEMMAVYDIDGRIRRANKSALEQLGFGKSAVGEHFDVHVAPQDRETVAQAFAQALSGKACEIGVGFLDAAGREVPVLANLSPIIVRGRVVGVVGAARDMTSERHFERELLRGRERFRSLFEASPNAIVAFTPEGIITEINVAMERLTGYRTEELVGKHMRMLVPPEFGERAAARIEAALAGESHNYRLSMLSREGKNISLDADMLPILVDGRAEGVFLIGKDLTREEALARLDQRDERMRALYRIASSPDADAGALIDEALALGASALGLEYGFVSEVADGIATVRHRFGPAGLLPTDSSAALLPIGALILSNSHATSVDDLDSELFAAALQARGLPWKCFIGCRLTVDGDPYGILVFLANEVRSPAFEQFDRDFIDLMSALIEPALRRARVDEELRDLAFHDPLTGLANRALLEEHVGRALARAKRTHELVAVHFLDLDLFKPVNDQYGHAAGDRVLREAARRFTAAVRAQDVVARIGGDEFVVLQTGVTGDEPVRQLAARLSRAMLEGVLLENGVSAVVEVSVGTAIYPKDALDTAGLLRVADAAMYVEKVARIKAT